MNLEFCGDTSSVEIAGQHKSRGFDVRKRLGAIEFCKGLILQIGGVQRGWRRDLASHLIFGQLPVVLEISWRIGNTPICAGRSLPASARRAPASPGQRTVMRIPRADRRTSSRKAPDLKPDREIAERIPARSRLPSNIQGRWRGRSPNGPEGRPHPWPCLRFHSRMWACRWYPSRDYQTGPR